MLASWTRMPVSTAWQAAKRHAASASVHVLLCCSVQGQGYVSGGFADLASQAGGSHRVGGRQHLQAQWGCGQQDSN